MPSLEKFYAMHQFMSEETTYPYGYFSGGTYGFVEQLTQFNPVFEETRAVHHIQNRIHQLFEKQTLVTALDIGAGRNHLLQELVSSDPRLSGIAISLGDPRTQEEKAIDQALHIAYCTLPVHTLRRLIKDIDFIFCFNMLKHDPHPIQTIHMLYNRILKVGGEMYIEWNGMGNSSRVSWENGSWDDVLSEWTRRGIDLKRSSINGPNGLIFDGVFFRKNTRSLPTRFVSQSVHDIHEVPVVFGTGYQISSIYTINRSKMTSKSLPSA